MTMSHSAAPAVQGMTLLEIIIASAIFIVVMAGVMEAQVASQRYVAMAETQDELLTDAGRAMEVINADLSVSGWWFEDRTADYLTALADRQRRYMPFVQIQEIVPGTDEGLGDAFQHTWRVPSTDAGLSFPLVPPALDAWLPGVPADREAPFTSTLVATVAERTAWDASFFARSQELIFAKAAVSSWSHGRDEAFLTTEDRRAPLFFSGTRRDWTTSEATEAAEEAKRARLQILYTSGWKATLDGSGNISGYTPRQMYRYDASQTGTLITDGDAGNIPYGVVMESGVLADPDNDLSAIQVNWQTIDESGFTTASQTSANIREYMYCVVRSPVGLGRLVRARKVQQATAPAADEFGVEVGRYLPRNATVVSNFYMQVDQVLSDNVVRCVFDTWRTVDAGQTTVSTLDVNNVRVRLYLARRSQADENMILTRIVDRVFAMRAENSAQDKDPQEADSNAAILGTAPIGIRF